MQHKNPIAGKEDVGHDEQYNEEMDFAVASINQSSDLFNGRYRFFNQHS